MCFHNRYVVAISSVDCLSNPRIHSLGLLLLVVVVTLLAFNGADAAAAAAAASASSLHSSLDVPSRSLSRHRRFITPKSSGWRFSFRVSFSLTIPLLGPTNGNGRLSASAPFAFNYALDDGFGLLTSGRKRRAVLLDDPKEEFAENERERYEMIGHMERLLSAHVDEAEGDGHACMLKALCQVAQVRTYTLGHSI